MAAKPKLLAEAEWKLFWQPATRRYEAGCRNFTYQDAIRHWTERLNPNDSACSCGQCQRARLFLKAIKAHHRKLTAAKKARAATKKPARKTRKTVAVRSRRRAA